MNRNEIVVIGGYGHVGKKVCLQLAELFPGYVYAAGRNKQKAEQFAESTNSRVHPMVIDVMNNFHLISFEKVKLVIVCVEQVHTDFPLFCLKQGIDYIDISASYRFLAQIESMHELAEKNGSTAIVSVGLAPGMTNLLGKWLQSQLDTVRELDIFLMLGLGDKHGEAAIRWTLQQAKMDFYRWSNGKQKMVKSFIGKKVSYFGQELGVRNAYDFDFADQHVIRKTLSIQEVRTYLCFDSALITDGIHFFKKMGILRLLPLQLSTKLLGKINLGNPRFIAKIVGRGTRDEKETMIETMVHGKEEATITATVTAWVAIKLYQNLVPDGVYHMEQVFEWSELYQSLENLIVWDR